MQLRSFFLICRSLAAAFTAVALVLAAGTMLGAGSFGAAETAVTAVNGSSAIGFLVGFLILSLALNLALPLRLPRVVFLLGLFPLLVGWRIAALSKLP